MSQKQEEIHEDYRNLDELLENLNVWDGPDKVEEATTRKYLESEIVEYVFNEESDVRYGRNIDKRSVTPKIFQSTEKVEVERVETDDKGDAFKINAKIANLDPDDKVNLFFEGFITELEGIVEDKPVIIRKS